MYVCSVLVCIKVCKLISVLNIWVLYANTYKIIKLTQYLLIKSLFSD